jgi:type I restriction enzyme S subunit
LDGPYVVGAFCARLRAKDGESAELLAALLESVPYRNWIGTLLAGTNIGNIRPDDILACPLRVPGNAAGRVALGAMLAKFRRLSERSYSVLAAKRVFKRVLLHELLTRRRRFPEFIDKPWAVARIRDVASVNPRVSAQAQRSTVVSFVPMAAVLEGGGCSGSQQREYSSLGSGYTPFQNDDVLVAKITPCFENMKGWLAEDLTNGVGLGSTEFHVIRAGNHVLPAWIYLHTLTHDFRGRGAAAMTGSAGQKRVQADFIERYPIPVPSRNEQARIVALAGQLEREIALLEQLRAAYEAQKRALMHRLHSGDLPLPATAAVPELAHA